jgi:hypothetical protein
MAQVRSRREGPCQWHDAVPGVARRSALIAQFSSATGEGFGCHWRDARRGPERADTPKPRWRTPILPVRLPKGRLTRHAQRHRPADREHTLTLPEPRRHRALEHLRFVAQQRCTACAGASQARRTIGASRSPAPWPARSATNSPCPWAPATTMSCICAATRKAGGRSAPSIPCRWPTSFGRPAARGRRRRAGRPTEPATARSPMRARRRRGRLRPPRWRVQGPAAPTPRALQRPAARPSCSIPEKP